MWTYLAILLSISVIFLVFVRKVVLYYRKPIQQPNEAEKDTENDSNNNKTVVSKKDRDRAEALCKKGLIMLKAGKEDDAIKCFVQALALNELHDETQHRLAVLYLKKQMYGAAAALFKRLIESSENPLYYSHLGLALYKQSDFLEAKNAYQKAVELDPERAARFVSLAQVYRSLDQFSHAAAALNKAIDIEQENIDFLLLMSSTQMDLKNYKEASEILERVLTLEPKNPDAKSMLKEVKNLSEDA